MDRDRLRSELRSCGLAAHAVERILSLHYTNNIEGSTLYETANQLIRMERKRLKLTDDFLQEDLDE